MPIITAIVAAATTAIATISAVATKVGAVVALGAKTLLAKLPTLGSINFVVEAIKKIAQSLGLIEKEEKPEELGAKAMESEKSLENFESAEKYIEHLRNEVELDIKKFEQMKEGERLACSAVGVFILAKGIEEKEDIEIPSDFLAEIGKQEMKVEEVKAYIKNFKENGFSEINLSDYLEGKLSTSENDEVSSVIEQTLKELNPELSDEEIITKMIQMEG